MCDREILQPFGTPPGYDDLIRFAPSGREQSGDQRLTHLSATEYCQLRHIGAYDVRSAGRRRKGRHQC
jgi:hypothetical protein